MSSVCLINVCDWSALISLSMLFISFRMFQLCTSVSFLWMSLVLKKVSEFYSEEYLHFVISVACIYLFHLFSLNLNAKLEISHWIFHAHLSIKTCRWNHNFITCSCLIICSHKLLMSMISLLIELYEQSICMDSFNLLILHYCSLLIILT